MDEMNKQKKIWCYRINITMWMIDFIFFNYYCHTYKAKHINKICAKPNFQ